MHLGYHISPEHGLITITGGESFALAELERLGQKLLQDPEFDPKLPQMVDFRGTQLPGGKDARNGVGSFLSQTYATHVHASIAIVVDGDQTDASIANMYKLVCMIGNAELFDNYDQALKWLMRREFAQPTARRLAGELL